MIVTQSVDGKVTVNGRAESRTELEAATSKLAQILGFQLSRAASLGQFQHHLTDSR